MAAAAYMGCTFSSALNRKAHYALLEAEDGWVDQLFPTFTSASFFWSSTFLLNSSCFSFLIFLRIHLCTSTYKIIKNFNLKEQRYQLFCTCNLEFWMPVSYINKTYRSWVSSVPRKEVLMMNPCSWNICYHFHLFYVFPDDLISRCHSISDRKTLLEKKIRAIWWRSCLNGSNLSSAATSWPSSSLFCVVRLEWWDTIETQSVTRRWKTENLSVRATRRWRCPCLTHLFNLLVRNLSNYVRTGGKGLVDHNGRGSLKHGYE